MDAAEGFVLAGGMEKAKAVLLRVFSRFVKSANESISKKKQDVWKDKQELPRDDAKNSADKVDDVVRYKLQPSKQRKATFWPLPRKLSGFLLRVSYNARGPLRRFFLVSRKRALPAYVFSVGDSEAGRLQSGNVFFD